MPHTNLFEFFDRGRLNPENVDSRVRAWSRTALIDFVQTSGAALQDKEPFEVVPPAPYRFEASAELSGLAERCDHPGCRVTKARELAQFAALYADEVYISNPFEQYDAHDPKYDLESHSLDVLQDLVVGDLQVLLLLRPLIEAGIVKFRNSPYDYCEGCRARLAGPDLNLTEAYASLEHELRQAFLEGCEFYLEIDDEEVLVSVRSDQGLLDHSEPVFAYRKGVLGALGIRSDSLRIDSPLPPDVVEDLDVLSSLVEPVLASLTLQTVSTRVHGSVFLSNRRFEVDAIGRVAPGQMADRSRELMSGLRHAVPSVFAREVSDLVRIRRAEANSFAAYRGALSRAIAETDGADPRDLPTIVSDIVAPEVSRLNIRLKTAKGTRAKRQRGEIVVGVGAIAMGLVAPALIPGASTLENFITGISASLAANTLRPGAAQEASSDSHYAFLWHAANE